MEKEGEVKILSVDNICHKGIGLYKNLAKEAIGMKGLVRNTRREKNYSEQVRMKFLR